MAQEEKDTNSDSSVILSDEEENNNDKLLAEKEKIFIEFMTYSNEYIKLRHQSHVNLSRGYLNLARGRMSNAGKFKRHRNIFNKEMTPLSTVEQLII